MSYHRCLNCGAVTGAPETHQACPDGSAPTWEVCTCGSGGHPRRCDLHPDAYEEHTADLNADADDAGGDL